MDDAGIENIDGMDAKTMEKEIDRIERISCKPCPENYFNGKKFVPLRLAKEIMTFHNFKTIDGETYYFEGGIYKPAQEIIEEYIVKILGEDSVKQKCIEVINIVRILSRSPSCELPLHLINLKNGLFDIETRTLQPHNPEYFTITQIPIEYEPMAFPDQFLQFMEEVVKPDDIQVLREWFGYCLYRDYPIAKAVMLIGSGANGKSTLLECLKRFVGPKNVVSVPLQSLGRDYRACALYGKLVNYFPDLSSRVFNDTGTFKVLTGNDYLGANRKYKDDIQFTNYAKLIFSCNNLPANYEDDSDAFYRRWIFINFPNQFIGEKADTRKLEKISGPEQLSGILNWALGGLYGLLERKQFSANSTTQETRLIYKLQSNPSVAFAEEYLEKTNRPDDYMAKDELYAMFQGYCDEKNVKIPTKEVFFKRLASMRFTLGKVTVLGKRVYVLQYVKLKSDRIEPVSEKDTTLDEY